MFSVLTRNKCCPSGEYAEVLNPFSKENLDFKEIISKQLSWYSPLLFMGMMMEGESDSSIPGSLQDCVLQPTFFSSVVPLGQVRGAVRTIWWRSDLMAVYTATTLDPAIKKAFC